MSNHRLQQVREQRGWSKTILAKALGIPVTTVEQWEQGFLVPSRSFQEALCLLFGVHPEILGFPAMADDEKQSTGTSFLLLPHSSIVPSMPVLDDAHVFGGVYDPALPLPSIYTNELIGRNDLLQQCRQQVLTQQNLALYGSPGIGKTALAVALAYDDAVRAQFSDGVLWAALGVQPHIPAVLSRWGKLLGVTTREIETHNQLEDWLQALRATIGERRLLLVLDDVWQVESLEALHLEGTNCAYILTTRFAHIATHLVADNALQIPELEEDDGVNLLARFAPAIIQDERDTAMALVRGVGGLPLALTLMGKYLGSRMYTKQPRRVYTALAYLRTAEQRLQLSVPQAPFERSGLLAEGVDISIQSVLAVSYRHLPVVAQQALCAFAVLPAKPVRITRETALAVTGVSVEVLDILCNAGLLEQSGTNDYMMHTIIADYARAQYADPEASARLARYGLHFIEAYHSNIAVLERESTLLLAALEKAWDLGWQAELIQGSCFMAVFLLQHGWYALAEQVLQRAFIAAAQSGDMQGQVHILEHLSSLAHLQGNYEQAQTNAQNGLTMAYQLGNQMYISRLLTILGVVAYERGDYTQAQEYYQEGLVLARQLGDQEQIGTLLKNLGVVAKKQGDYLVAEAYYQQGLTLARQIGHSDLTSLLLMNLGVIANERGDYPLAEAYYQQGLVLARQLQYRERICVLLSNLGVVADARGNYTQAETFLREGLSLARQLNHRERTSLLLLNLGVVANRQGKDTQAEAYLQEGLTLARQLGHRERTSLFLLNLGDIVLEHGDLVQAEVYLQEGLELARQIGHPERISDLLLRLGTLAAKRNSTDQAEACYQEGLVLARQIGLPQLICRLLAAWGDLYLQLQQKEAAENAFREMLVLVPEGNQRLLAFAQYGLARVAAAKGQLSEARSLAESCSAIFEVLGHRQRSAVRAFLESLQSDNI